MINIYDIFFDLKNNTILMISSLAKLALVRASEEAESDVLMNL